MNTHTADDDDRKQAGYQEAIEEEEVFTPRIVLFGIAAWVVIILVVGFGCYYGYKAALLAIHAMSQNGSN